LEDNGLFSLDGRIKLKHRFAMTPAMTTGGKRVSRANTL